MTSIWQDIRFSLRMIASAPGYAAIVTLTLALGIGANSTIFSWINSSLLNPVPGVSKSNEIVSLTQGYPGGNPLGFSYPELEAMRDGQQSFSGITACMFAPMSLTGKGKPERVWGMVASANYFEVLGVRPILGRGFLPGEDEKQGGAPVAVISYRLWQTHFAANPAVVGQPIAINQRSYTIVGVAPALFQGSITGLRMETWVPLMMEAQLIPGGDALHDRLNDWLFVYGRLQPGVSRQQAQEEMTLHLQRDAKNHPQEHSGHNTVTAHPLWRNPFSFNIFFAPLLPVLMAIAGLVLLLACANVANLMLVRSMGRRREIAIRMSLGASRWRLVRQWLVESLILALAGGALALLITLWTAGTLIKFIPAMDFPISLTIRTDRTVFLATMLISLLTGVIFGILPALRASSLAPATVLKEDTGNASGGLNKMRLAGGLVVAQISLSLLLLVCAGLFIRSVMRAGQINPGFNDRNVLIASYDLFGAGYSEDAGEEFHRQLLAILEGLPGIESVALSSRVPLGLIPDSTTVQPAGYIPQPDESLDTPMAIITPNYFRTIQIPILQGREFTAQDSKTSQRAVIVNQAFAHRYWPNQEALGKQLNSDLTHEWFTVIGVARDSKVATLTEKPTPFLYLPLAQVYRPTMLVHARVAGDPLAIGKTVERTIHQLNPDLVVFDVNSLEISERVNTFPQHIAGTFVGAFGVLALILAAVGIYGVTAFTTRQRTREIGIRMALGASKEDILRLVLGHGLRLTFIGLTLGLAAAFALTRHLSKLLLGVTSTDALTFSSVALLLCAVALLACFLPARRAMRVDPIVALHYQ
jgi:predicted permease